MRGQRTIACIIFSVVNLCLLNAETYYVAANDPLASDSNAGTIDAPLRTIARGVDKASLPGDVVYVRAGTYDERISVKYSGSPGGGYINIAGYPLDQTKPVMRGFDIQGRSYVRIIGFEITHVNTNYLRGVNIATSNHIEILDNYIHNTYGEGGMVRCTNNDFDHIVVRGNEFYMAAAPGGVAGAATGNGWAVQTVGGSYILVEYNVAHRVGDFINIHSAYAITRNNYLYDYRDYYWPDAPSYGHTDMFQPFGLGYSLYEVYESNFLADNWEDNSHVLEMQVLNASEHDVMFRGNVAYNFGSYGMESGGVSYGRMYNNTFSRLNLNFPRAQVFWYHAYNGVNSQHNVNINNIISDSGGYAIAVNAGEADVTASNNLIHNTGSDPSAVSTADPAFVSVVGNDYHLQPGSPAIGKGTPMTTVTSSSGSGTFFTVQDAGFFCDGFGIAEGDIIKVGSNGPVRITSISSNTITVASSISWNTGDGVTWRNQDSSPDIGAYEYRSPGYGFGVHVQVTAAGQVTASATNPDCVRFVQILVDEIPVAVGYGSQATYTWFTAALRTGSAHVVEARAYALYADPVLYQKDRVEAVVTSAGLQVTPYSSSASEAPSGLRLKQ